MTEEKQSLKFPMKCADKCPSCGSTEGRVAEYVAQLRRQGRLPKMSLNPAASLATIGVIFQEAMFGLATQSIPMLGIQFEVCKCGTIYCTGLTEASMPVPQRPPISPIRRGNV